MNKIGAILLSVGHVDSATPLSGVLAAKIHMKHVTLVTTEGYAARPGGAQAELLRSRGEQAPVAAEAGPDASGIPQLPGRDHAIGARCGRAGRVLRRRRPRDHQHPGDAAEAPKVQRNDRDILNLLSKRAATLHLGIANYCWLSRILDNQHYA